MSWNSLPRRGHMERLEDRLLLSVSMTAREQQLLYLINQARSDPAAEAARYGIDLNEGLDPGTITDEPKQPLAPHQSLVDAAQGHAQNMLDEDFFAHENNSGQSPADRAVAAGYPTSAVGENIGWGGTTGALDKEAAVYERHEGLFRSSGHRENMLNAAYVEAGVGVRFGEFQSYHAAMVAESFGIRRAGPFLTGVVFADANRNGSYDPGEGLSDVTITVGTEHTTTSEVGGWSFEVTPGSYAVTASGGDFVGRAAAPAEVEQDNVEIDFRSGWNWGTVNFQAVPPPPAALDDAYRVAEGMALDVPAATGVLANDLDPQSDPLTAVLIEEPSYGTVTLDSDGSFLYTPQADYSGIDRFTYRAYDEQRESNEATVAIEVVEHVGTIDFFARSHQEPSDGKLWYHFTASREGILTAELTAGTFGPDAETTLYEVPASGGMQELTRGSTRLDYGQADGGQQYAIRITGLQSGFDLTLANMVQLSSDRSAATVFGTDADDTLEAAAGASTSIVVNGLLYDFDGLSELRFPATGGADTVVLKGTRDDEAATLYPTSGTLIGPNFRVEWDDVESLTVDGGGGDDTLRLYDSPGDDRLIAAPGYGEMSGKGFSNRATSFVDVYAYATAGGQDTALLYDSAADDRFVSAAEYGKLSGEGFSIETESFEVVHAFATAGGRDVAQFYDSPGDDSFYASPQEAALYGQGSYYRAKHFEVVHAYATAGGYDAAQLYDSPGDDSFYGSPVEATLFGEGFYNRAKHFEGVYAYATAGGYDEGTLYDSAGRDQFVSAPAYAAMFGDGFYNRAMHFDGIYAMATAGGVDVAKMFDSPGDDQFVAAPTYGAVFGEGFYNRAMHFDGVHAYATAGGYDAAKLFDSPGDDTFYADPISGGLYAEDYFNRAKYFEAVHAYATAGGHDVAWLFDSAGDDSFLSTDVYGAVYGQGFYNRAKHFEEVYAAADAGGYDEAYLRDSALVDLLEADANWVRLSNGELDFLYQVTAFEHVRARAATPGDTKSFPDASVLDVVLELEGPWQDA